MKVSYMNKDIKLFIELVKQQFILQKEKDMQINYILSKNVEHSSPLYLCIANSKKDPEEIRSIMITNNNEMEYQKIAEWDFNIDDYILDDLEKGYKIAYMPLQEHYNMWCAIKECEDDIKHKDGLHQYLDYCKKEGINAKTISLLGFESIDIMSLYHEKNQNYQIINEMTFGNRSIVLGHNPKSPSPYVTWQSSPTRYRGFDMGHYFSKFNDAYEDYINRCIDLLNDHLKIQKHKIKPKSKELIR